jgi:hypothetical protein
VSGPRRDGEARRAFLLGLRTHHPLILLAALLPLVGILVPLSAIVAAGRYTAVPEERLLRSGGDDVVHVSYEVAELKAHPPRALPVYLLGGSATRECTVSEGSLGAEVQRRSGVSVEVHTLAGNDQTFADDLALINNLPDGGGIVVIAVGFERFSHTPSRRGGLSDGLLVPGSSPARSPFELAPGVVGYAASYVRDHFSDLVRLRLPWTSFVPHRYMAESAWSAQRKRLTLARWLETLGGAGGTFAPACRAQAATLERAVAAAHDRGFTVLLVEQPFDRQAVGHMVDGERSLYGGLTRALAARQRATYVDFLAQTELTDKDFHDLSHLLASGRAKYQHQLASAVAAEIEKQPSDLASAR